MPFCLDHNVHLLPFLARPSNDTTHTYDHLSILNQSENISNPTYFNIINPANPHTPISLLNNSSLLASSDNTEQISALITNSKTYKEFIRDSKSDRLWIMSEWTTACKFWRLHLIHRNFSRWILEMRCRVYWRNGGECGGGLWRRRTGICFKVQAR